MKRQVFLGIILLLGLISLAKADDLRPSDFVTLNTSNPNNCFTAGGVRGACGGTLVVGESDEHSGNIVLGIVLFAFVNDFNVYLTDANGTVSDHIFSSEGLGIHDAIYFEADMGDPVIGTMCPDPRWCVLETGFPQDLSSLVVAQNPNVNGISLIVQSGDAGDVDAETPEPGSLALLGTGLFGLAGAVRRKFLS